MIDNIATEGQGLTSNAFYVSGERTVLVDTGANFDAVSSIENRGGSLDAVVLTHTHSDHVGNLASVKTAFDVDVWGFDTGQANVDFAIEDNETVRLGDHDYRALHTPGHKNDHLCFYSAGAGVLFSGDLVFANGSFGRTDLEEGDRRLLIESIERVLSTIDESLAEMYAGHGPPVTDDPYRHVEMARQYAEQF